MLKYILLICLLLKITPEVSAADNLAKHPRLIFTDRVEQRLKTIIATGDNWSNELLNRMLVDADKLLNMDKIKYDLSVNRQLLKISRETIRRVMILGVCYRLTGKDLYAKRLTQELLAVAAFPDWNPEHFLDTAEMTMAVSLGYDWLYNVLTQAQRKIIREAIISKGLIAGQNFKAGENVMHNWNLVRHGALVAASLAVYEDAVELAELTLATSKEKVVPAFEAYGQDGVFPEGPVYWGYATVYATMMSSALQTATGDDWGISQRKRFLAGFDFIMKIYAPSASVVNYADSSDKLGSLPNHMWLAAQTGKQKYATFSQQLIKGYIDNKNKVGWRLLPLALLWYDIFKSNQTDREVRAWVGHGVVEMAVLCKTTTSDKIFISLKGGDIKVNHGHMDIGSFVLERDGVRWSHDLGPDYSAYSKSEYFITDQSSQRWSFLRLNNFGHSTLSIGDNLQQVNGANPIIDCSGNNKFSLAVLNMSAAYSKVATNVLRTIKLYEDSSITVDDNFKGVKPGNSIVWRMITKAQIVVSADMRRAVLTQEGKNLTAEIVSPEQAIFSVVALTPKRKSENQNRAYRTLQVKINNAVSTGSLCIKFLK